MANTTTIITPLRSRSCSSTDTLTMSTKNCPRLNRTRSRHGSTSRSCARSGSSRCQSSTRSCAVSTSLRAMQLAVWHRLAQQQLPNRNRFHHHHHHQHQQARALYPRLVCARLTPRSSSPDHTGSGPPLATPVPTQPVVHVSARLTDP